MKKLLALAFVALLFTAAACSDDKQSPALPAPNVPTTAVAMTAAPTTVVPTTVAPTTTTLPDFLNAPIIQHVCAPDYCVDAPTDLRNVEPVGTNGYTDINAGYDVDHATGHICPLAYHHLPQCDGFDGQGYGVGMTLMPGVSPEDALQQSRNGFVVGVFTDVHDGTFQGEPAVFAIFHTNTGGSGPYVDVWHKDAIYHIQANGQTAPSDLGQQFIDSFQFTD